MEAAARQCGAACGPQPQPQRARMRVSELQPLRRLRRREFERAEYTGIPAASELTSGRLASREVASLDRKHLGPSQIENCSYRGVIAWAVEPKAQFFAKALHIMVLGKDFGRDAEELFVVSDINEAA